MKKWFPMLILALLLVGSSITWVNAGEPTGKIGPMNPTMFKCVSRDGTELIQPDPFRKPTARVGVRGGKEYELQTIEDFLKDNPDAQELICTSQVQIDFGFDTEDAVAFNAYLEDLEDECKDKDSRGKLVPITDTRIEGFVYEFHPKDPQNPETTEWFGVPSRYVTVQAKGITFEIFWNSDDNGAYYFQNLGAGPILLNLRLPPDAHMINPNVFIDSTGLEETQRVDLAFYRGNVGPADPRSLVTPSGNLLPVISLGDIEDLSMCGYMDLPGVATSFEPPLTDSSDVPAIPDVGGILPKDNPLAIVTLSAILLIIMPVTGFLAFRRDRTE